MTDCGYCARTLDATETTDLLHYNVQLAGPDGTYTDNVCATCVLKYGFYRLERF